MEESCLKPALGGAGGRTCLVPDFDPPVVPGGRSQRRSIPFDEQCLVGVSPPGVPQQSCGIGEILGAFGRREPVGALCCPAPVTGELPRQSRAWFIDAKRLLAL